MKRVVWLSLVAATVACGGSKARPEMGYLQGQPIVETPGAPPLSYPARSDAPGATPDTPTGDAAKRDAELAARAAPLLAAPSTSEAAFTRDGKRTILISDRDGLPQLYVSEAGTSRRIATTTQRMSDLVVAPGGKDVLFRSDTGADENWSLFRVGLDGQNLIELTPGKKLARDVPFIPDGHPSQIYFSARAMTDAKSTVYVSSATAATEPKAIYTDDKPTYLTAVTADAKLGLLQRSIDSSNGAVLALDLESGKTRPLFPTDDRKLAIFDARLSRDGRLALIATDEGGESNAIVAIDVKTGKQLARHVFKSSPHALIYSLVVAREGGQLGVSLINGDHSELYLLDARTLSNERRIAMPPGSGFVAAFSDNGKQLIAVWSTPDSPSDHYVVDTARLTVSGPPRRALAVPATDVLSTEVAAFDGGKIPLHAIIPKGEQAKKHPVIVAFHGGPAGVAMIRWNAVHAFFSSLGYVIVEPNVRGSSGYGRAFEAADNGHKRLDALKDVETASRWVASQPWADKDRLVVYGGSYGGYTSLIALTRWPDIFRAGVDLFGVADLRTLMKSTSGEIRDLLLTEIGDPEKDGEFLDSISPLTAVTKIVDPVFVYAGANDPRVPRSESDAIVKALRARSVPVEYMVAADEGHSMDRRDNVLAFASRLARFLEAAMR